MPSLEAKIRTHGEDEDEDVEFKVCTFIDKYKNNYTQTDCKNIVADDTKENITFSIK